MAKIGGNDPCPCGSGKAFKACCLPTEQQQWEENEERMRLLPLAWDWLEANYPDAMSEAIHDGFLQGRSTAELEALDDLPQAWRQVLRTNQQEWLLADGFLDLPNGSVPVRQALLDTGGPRLTAVQQQWLEAMSANRLGLYEVQRAIPGVGLDVQDLLLPRSERVSLWVEEGTASCQLQKWQILGARLVQWQDQWVMTDAGYRFPSGKGASVMRKLKEVRDQMGRHPDQGAGPEPLTRALIGEWLGFLLDLPPFPELLDPATFEVKGFIADMYAIENRQQLAEALAGLAEVEGDYEQGEWIWLDPQGSRSVWARLYVISEDPLGTGYDERLEVYTRTQVFSERVNDKLLDVCGLSLEWLTTQYREGLSNRSRNGTKSPAAAQEFPPDMFGEDAAEILQALIEHVEADWADRPHPVLDHWTPRQAVADPAKKEEVIRLLKDLQVGENQRAPERGQAPVDFSFLWEELGLTSSPDR